MTLEELIEYINDGTIIDLYEESTFDLIDMYYKDEIPEHYLECEVTDIFGGRNEHISIEINSEIDEED